MRVWPRKEGKNFWDKEESPEDSCSVHLTCRQYRRGADMPKGRTW